MSIQFPIIGSTNIVKLRMLAAPPSRIIRITYMEPSRRLAALVLFSGACVWGVYWIPLRYFSANGIDGLWAAVLVMASPIIVAVPAALRFGSLRRDQFLPVIGIGIGTGSAMVLYFAALVLTDVVRAIFLFYMLPVWTTIAAWVLLGERPGPRRIFAVLLGLAGLWMLLGGREGWPVPQNVGDWFGIGAGVCWGVTLSLIRHQSEIDTWTSAAGTFVTGTCVALLLIAVFPATISHVPAFSGLGVVLLLALAFGCFAVWPSTLAMLWGSRYLSPATSALITMSELITGVVSAALLIGTSLDRIAIVGAVLITVAAVVDVTTPEHEGVSEVPVPD